MGDLVCYQQSGATNVDDSVPGCPGTAQDNVDYCVDKKRLKKSGKYLNFVLQGDLEPGSLGRCQGEPLSAALVMQYVSVFSLFCLFCSPSQLSRSFPSFRCVMMCPGDCDGDKGTSGWCNIYRFFV